MTQITKLSDLKLGTETVTVRGWIEKLSSHKKHAFVILRDGSGEESHIQVFVPGSMTSDLVTESYVEFSGNCL